ncbi:hypothetical protein FQR65_LT00878 [Abscondita terminalis]|nr:hypothetical protein FQR65_LT00878 [Abscondita terminalis]
MERSSRVPIAYQRNAAGNHIDIARDSGQGDAAASMMRNNARQNRAAWNDSMASHAPRHMAHAHGPHAPRITNLTARKQKPAGIECPRVFGLACFWPYTQDTDGGTQKQYAGRSIPDRVSVGKSASAWACPIRLVNQLTASFRALPGRNFGTLAFLILMVSPVRGLRPVRAARADTANVPKPTRVTVPPFFRVVLTAPIRGVERTASGGLRDIGLAGNDDR